MPGVGGDSKLTGWTNRSRCVGHAEFDVDAIDEILEAHVLGINRDLVGVSQSRRRIHHVQLEDAVANLPRDARGVGIE